MGDASSSKAFSPPPPKRAPSLSGTGFSGSFTGGGGGGGGRGGGVGGRISLTVALPFCHLEVWYKLRVPVIVTANGDCYG